jgi:hypothetical protein
MHSLQSSAPCSRQTLPAGMTDRDQIPHGGETTLSATTGPRSPSLSVYRLRLEEFPGCVDHFLLPETELADIAAPGKNIFDFCVVNSS